MKNKTMIGHILAFVCIMIWGSTLCFVIWNHSCSILGSVRTNQYVYLNPIATIIFSVIILHEKITLCIVLGTILTLSGLIISEYKKES